MINTPWGYDILDDHLPEILTIQEFNAMTCNKFAGDQRIPSVLAAVTASLRNYCGWHVGGQVECEVTYTFDDLHVVRHGCDITVQLPTRMLVGITSIEINGVNLEVPHVHFKRNGFLRIYNCPCFARYDTITVDFISGVTDAGLASVVASRVSNVLSGQAGVASESAGGVSISYSSSFVAGVNATALLTADKEFLLQYRITELL